VRVLVVLCLSSVLTWRTTVLVRERDDAEDGRGRTDLGLVPSHTRGRRAQQARQTRQSLDIDQASDAPESTESSSCGSVTSSQTSKTGQSTKGTKGTQLPLSLHRHRRDDLESTLVEGCALGDGCGGGRLVVRLFGGRLEGVGVVLGLLLPVEGGAGRRDQGSGIGRWCGATSKSSEELTALEVRGDRHGEGEGRGGREEEEGDEGTHGCGCVEVVVEGEGREGWAA
jgi:hypothetical protein